MSIHLLRAGRLLASVSFVAILSACAVTPVPFDAAELTKQATEDRTSMFERGEPIAGRLTVAEAIRQSGAPGVDVSSGVERARGVKDPAKIAAFVAAARAR
jgi:phosphoribosylanthranilate isomerase